MSRIQAEYNLYCDNGQRILSLSDQEKDRLKDLFVDNDKKFLIEKLGETISLPVGELIKYSNIVGLFQVVKEKLVQDSFVVNELIKLIKLIDNNEQPKRLDLLECLFSILDKKVDKDGELIFNYYIFGRDNNMIYGDFFSVFEKALFMYGYSLEYIELSMKSLLSGHDYYFEYYFFDNIISIFKKDIIFLSIFLNAIIKDEKAMLVFLSMKEEFSKCFYETVLNLKITQKEKDIIQKLTYTVLESHGKDREFRIRGNTLTKYLCLLLQRFSRSGIRENILKNFESKQIFWHDEAILRYIAYSITKKEIVRLKSTKYVFWGTHLGLRIYQSLCGLERENKTEVKKIFEVCFKDEIKKYDNSHEIQMRQKEKKEIEENKKKKKYIRNVRKLIKNDNKSNIYFPFLNLYMEDSSLFISSDKDLLIKQVETFFIGWSNTIRNAMIKRGDENTIYLPEFLHNNILTLTLQIIQKLNIDTSSFRRNIIRILPFSYNNALPLKILGDLKSIDIEILLKYFHKERDLIDDLRKERFHVFLSLLEHSIQTIKISPKLSKDILRLLFDYLNEANSIHSKKEVLDLIGKILVHHHIKFPDMEKKIRILFYSNHKSWNYFEDIITINPELQEEEIGNFELALIANEILIRVYQCKDAFKWRLEQLNNKGVQCFDDFDPREVTHSYTPTKIHRELIFDKEFISPVHDYVDKIKYDNISNLIDTIVDETFKLLPDKYGRYRSYVYLGLKPYFVSLGLDDLIAYRDKIKNKNGSNYFINYFLIPWLAEITKGDKRAKRYFDLFLEENREKSILGKQVNDLKKEIVSFEKNQRIINSQNYVIVEGKTDKFILEKAYGLLYPNKQRGWLVINARGCTNIIKMIENFIIDNEEDINCIGLFDYDFAGYSYASKGTDIYSVEKIREGNIHYFNFSAKQNSSNFYGGGCSKAKALMLPINSHDDIHSQIIKKSEPNEEIETFELASHMPLECFLYNNDIKKSELIKYFDTDHIMPGGGRIIKFSGNKDNFAKEFITYAQTKNSGVLSNLQALFEFIERDFQLF